MIDFIKQQARLSSPLVLVIVVAIGVVWLWRRRSSNGPRWYFSIVLVGFGLLTTPIGAGLLVGLFSRGLTRVESRADGRGCDAVVVLGGGASTATVGGTTAGELAYGSMLRVLEGARVFKLIGARFIVASGGRPRPERQLKPESELMRDVLVSAGVPASAVVEESQSKTTREEAQLMGPLLAAHGARCFVLVTSPTHMRRSLAVFRAAGMDPIPSIAPVRSENVPRPPLLLPNDESLWLTDTAIYDTAAWVYYEITGWR